MTFRLWAFGSTRSLPAGGSIESALQHMAHAYRRHWLFRAVRWFFRECLGCRGCNLTFKPEKHFSRLRVYSSVSWRCSLCLFGSIDPELSMKRDVSLFTPHKNGSGTQGGSIERVVSGTPWGSTVITAAPVEAPWGHWASAFESPLQTSRPPQMQKRVLGDFACSTKQNSALTSQDPNEAGAHPHPIDLRRKAADGWYDLLF